MRGKKQLEILLGALLLACVSSLITLIFYLINMLVFSTHPYVSPMDAFFIEGILSLVGGILLLIGRGGLSYLTLKAAVLAATAEALSKSDVIGPDEIMRRDRWKPIGFIRVALILIMAGLIMIAIYFLAQ